MLIYIYIYIMNKTKSELLPGFRRSNMSSVRGNQVTMTPNKASSGEELYIDIPKLKMDSCLVLGSLHLLFDFKVSYTKSAFMNNLPSLLKKRLQIGLSGENVYDCNDD